MNRFLLFLLFLSFLFSRTDCLGQVKFSATAEPAEVSKNEMFTLRLVVENADRVQDIIPPGLGNFMVISGPNQESGMTSINGNVKRYIALNFTLQPKGPGTFIIPSTIARADGKELKSNPVKVKVNNTLAQSNTANNAFTSPFGGMDPFEDMAPRNTYSEDVLKKGENAVDKIKKNIFVRLETDKTTCYVGEPVIATYKLYTRLKSESNLTKNPSFNGFSVIDLQQPDNQNARIEKFNGKEYNVYVIRKAQLYPLQPGSLELEPAEIENNVRFIKADYAKRRDEMMNDIFRDFADATIPAAGMEEHRVTLRSNPLSILVKPLPEAEKPVGYRGAVGNFTIGAGVAKDQFITGDAGKFILAIGGSGNLQMVNTPELVWPDGMEGFEPKVTDELNKITVPVSGKKIFEFPFTVTKPGNYTMPAVSFHFFDPKEARYKTIATQPVHFTVTAGSGKPEFREAPVNSKMDDSLLNRFFSNRWRVVGLVSILIICGLVFWLIKESRMDKKLQEEVLIKEQHVAEQEKEEDILQSRKDPLEEAAKVLAENNTTGYYSILNQCLKNYLSQKLQIPAEELNKRAIAEKMDSKGFPNEVTLQVSALIDEIEWKLYTPYAASGEMQDTYNKTDELIQLVNVYRV